MGKKFHVDIEEINEEEESKQNQNRTQDRENDAEIVLILFFAPFFLNGIFSKRRSFLMVCR